MAEHRLGIIMHGITGRMGYNQHLKRSILAIRSQGGVRLTNGDTVQVDPIIVGRNADKLKKIAQEENIERWTTNLDEALANKDDQLFFDAASTSMRADLIQRAMAQGKHIYCEKPTASTLEEALAVAREAERCQVKTGVVHDKLFLPGLIKLKQLKDEGFFGRILSVRGEFGYWVFVGDKEPAQRPSWNYRKQDGGGIIIDMLCHWRYVLDNVVAPVEAVSCLGVNHISQRFDESGQAYEANADDAAFSTFKLKEGIVAHFNSSWCTRVRRDDLVTFQIDGTEGSAVAGLTRCYTQSLADTPRPVWNPDKPQQMNFLSQWQEYQANAEFDNGFKVQWELFIRHLFNDGQAPYTLLDGAKGVQLAELGLRSWQDQCWMTVPELKV